MGNFNLNDEFYAQKKVLHKCIFCNKYKAVKKGTRNDKARFKCQNCLRWFVAGGSLKEKDNDTEKENIFINHLDGISYRKLAIRTKIKKTKLCKTVNELTADIQDNFEVTNQLLNQLKYSGRHIVDGKYIPVKEIVVDELLKASGKIPKSKKRKKVVRGKVLVWGADYESHDIPHFEFGDSENSFVFNNYFQYLKSIGYPMKSLTTDEKGEIIRAAKRHFSDCIIQLCIRHYLCKINKLLTIKNIRIKIRAKEKQIEKLFDGSESEYIPPTRFYSIKQLVKLHNEISALEFKYELLLDFQEIINLIVTASSYEIAEKRIESLNKYFWPKRKEMNFPKEHVRLVKKMIIDFEENKEHLLNYLKYPHLNIPSTTNLVEGNNSQLELRLSSIRGFENETTAKNYINSWIVKRRFTKFTDCRKQFKKLNGKSPLECAGADISDVQNWIKSFRKFTKSNSPLGG